MIELNKPKQFLFDLTSLLLTRLFATSPTGWVWKRQTANPSMPDTVSFEKDLLLYFADEKPRPGNCFGLGWRVSKNILMVNNANIGGYKVINLLEK
jgi:hypothetical protein